MFPFFDSPRIMALLKSTCRSASQEPGGKSSEALAKALNFPSLWSWGVHRSNARIVRARTEAFHYTNCNRCAALWKFRSHCRESFYLDRRRLGGHYQFDNSAPKLVRPPESKPVVSLAHPQLARPHLAAWFSRTMPRMNESRQWSWYLGWAVASETS